MRGGVAAADLERVHARSLLAVLGGVVAFLAFVGAATTATAGRGCLSTVRDGGYSYAGHQAASRGHGVRATITLTREPSVAAGHVAGWVGVGGPGQGAKGDDAWIQAGIAALPGLGNILYAEIAREGVERELVVLDEHVTVGRPYRVAVLEAAGAPGRWRVWVDGRPVTSSVRMPESSGRWAPIVTAESWNGQKPVCNGFGFRFEHVVVARTLGGSWRPFVSGHRFLDGTHVVHELPAAPGSIGRHRGTRSVESLRPYAFFSASRS